MVKLVLRQIFKGLIWLIVVILEKGKPLFCTLIIMALHTGGYSWSFTLCLYGYFLKACLFFFKIIYSIIQLILLCSWIVVLKRVLILKFKE